ncbi:MAG: hypothetical protein LC624_12295 [Halobacteriales archaeon]|nr:hypothetical protein [Halobacteriales archaeon]
MGPDEDSPAAVRKALKGWKRPVYMVHEHDARSHHFDLRIEYDGVLKSWALPKGVPLGEGVKHLAVRVPEHALSYASFEGIIEEGQYGAGEVRIWDRGTFVERERAEGKYTLDLQGRKAKGTYHLVHAKLGGQWPNWLIFRKDWPPGHVPKPRGTAKRS